MALEVNDLIHGFRITRIRPVEDQKGELVEMVHEKTGASLAWLKRADVNKTFCIGFKTIPSDDTGVFHICEHSVLNGSDKYPVREPFVDLLKTSLQTFLNAMTYPDKTIYPVSSRNDKDFLNLMDVYLDGVFHPQIYHNPNIFYQEGWHYEIRDPKDEPVYKGVVLNEMRGAFASVDEVIINEVNRILFPDNCYRFVSGGDPEHITDLSYEKFTRTHSKFYHPSNARIFLDGDMNISDVLAEINDGYLSKYDKEDISFDIPMQKITDAADVEIPYEIAPGESSEHRTEIALAKIMGSYEDLEKIIACNVLSSVIAGSNESPLKKAVLDKGLAQDLDFSVVDELQQPYFVLIARNTDKEKKQELLDTIHDCAEKLVRDGIDKEQIRAVLNQMEFHYHEQTEPAGVVNATLAYRSWLYGGDPLMYLNCSGVYEDLRKKADGDYYENLLADFLLDDAHLNIVTAVPDDTLGKKNAEKEAAKLHAHKLAWGDEINKYIDINKKLDAWQASQDTPQQKATLPKLAISDVNPLPQRFEAEVKEFKHIPMLVYPASDNGIVYFNLYFSIAGVTRERIPEVSLMADLLTHLRTTDHSVEELAGLIRSRIGSLSFNVEAFSDHDDPLSCVPVIRVACSVLKKNLADAVDLIIEIVQKTVYEKEAILPILQQDVEGFRQGLISSGHGIAAVRAGAHYSCESVVREYAGGYEAGNWTMDLLNHYDERADQLLQALDTDTAVLFTSSRLTVSFTDGESEKEIRRLIDTLDYGEFERCVVHYPLLESKKEAIVIPAAVGYSACSINLNDFDLPVNGSLGVMSQILTYGYLWNEIRVRGGAYGTGFSTNSNGSMVCWSYRDPTPDASLEKYAGAAGYIRDFAAGDEDLNGYIIGTIAAGEPLLMPMQKVHAADSRWFRSFTWEDRCRRRKEILSCTKKDLSVYEKALSALGSNGAQVMIAPDEQCRAAEKKGFSLLEPGEKES